MREFSTNIGYHIALSVDYNIAFDVCSVEIEM